ncbi:MAG: hypothetical protein AAGJ83_13645 [Planctomycetota bacterium]
MFRAVDADKCNPGPQASRFYQTTAIWEPQAMHTRDLLGVVDSKIDTP